MMINIVTFKWKKITNHKGSFDVQMPCGQYTEQHVNTLYNSIKRNTTVDFKFTCITDDPTGLDPEIEYVPLWDKCKNLGGCYNRLYVFSKDMKDILGDRFMCIDLDTVITGNIDHLLTVPEDFAINAYNGSNNADKDLALFSAKSRKRQPKPKAQKYNGALFIMNAGARSQVWEKFEFEKSDLEIQKLRREIGLVGSDQAWIHHILGPNEKTFSQKDGIFDISKIENASTLPKNSSIIFFHGNHDPLTSDYHWAKEHWR